MIDGDDNKRALVKLVFLFFCKHFSLVLAVKFNKTDNY